MKTLKQIATMIMYILIIINVSLLFLVKNTAAAVEFQLGIEILNTKERLYNTKNHIIKENYNNENMSTTIQTVSQEEIYTNIESINLQESRSDEMSFETSEQEEFQNNIINENTEEISIVQPIVETKDNNETMVNLENKPQLDSIEEETSIELENEQEFEIQTTSTSNSTNIVELAQSYLDSKYVSGGSSPETGFDCSGFTQYVYSQFGISLNRVAADQANNGTPINKEDLQPGDLLLFTYYGSESIGHTGIYIGDGQFIHAANSNRGVVTDTIESGYYLDNYVGARRLQ